jgi:hypothetical protein
MKRMLVAVGYPRLMAEGEAATRSGRSSARRWADDAEANI